MYNLPDNQIRIDLTEGDMKKAIENYLNDHLLKKPCTVVELEYPNHTRHSYTVRFEKAFEPVNEA